MQESKWPIWSGLFVKAILERGRQGKTKYLQTINDRHYTTCDFSTQHVISLQDILPQLKISQTCRWVNLNFLPFLHHNTFPIHASPSTNLTLNNIKRKKTVETVLLRLKEVTWVITKKVRMLMLRRLTIQRAKKVKLWGRRKGKVPGVRNGLRPFLYPWEIMSPFRKRVSAFSLVTREQDTHLRGYCEKQMYPALKHQ